MTKQEEELKCTKVTHRALGNHVAEELLIDQRSIPLLFEIETEQHSDLWLIGLVVWIHLEQRKQKI